MTTFDAIGTWWLFESVRQPGPAVPGFEHAATDVVPTEGPAESGQRPPPPIPRITPPR